MLVKFFKSEGLVWGVPKPGLRFVLMGSLMIMLLLSLDCLADQVR